MGPMWRTLWSDSEADARGGLATARSAARRRPRRRSIPSSSAARSGRRVGAGWGVCVALAREPDCLPARVGLVSVLPEHELTPHTNETRVRGCGFARRCLGNEVFFGFFSGSVLFGGDN